MKACYRFYGRCESIGREAAASMTAYELKEEIDYFMGMLSDEELAIVRNYLSEQIQTPELFEEFKRLKKIRE